MHIWFILDGNRRWATSKWLVKMLGHTHWVDNVESILELCLKENIETVSMWIIAKKNLENRWAEELEHLFWLIRSRIPSLIKNFIKKWVNFNTVWDLDLLPKDIKELMLKSTEETKKWTNMNFVLAIWYWWQDEIIRWVKKYIRDNIEELKNNPEELLAKLDEKSFLDYIDTGKFPAPDLIVRTGWDTRLSWYFLYQSEYSEYYFTPTYWPAFEEKEFYVALNSLKSAKRNFGK